MFLCFSCLFENKFIFVFMKNIFFLKKKLSWCQCDSGESGGCKHVAALLLYFKQSLVTMKVILWFFKIFDFLIFFKIK